MGSLEDFVEDVGDLAQDVVSGAHDVLQGVSGRGGPAVPPPPEPPAPAPRRASERRTVTRGDTRRRRLAGGLAGTILTSPLGAGGAPATASRTLLGV